VELAARTLADGNTSDDGAGWSGESQAHTYFLGPSANLEADLNTALARR
jgi:hypothetical protein